jgi:hypothetical protein
LKLDSIQVRGFRKEKGWRGTKPKGSSYENCRIQMRVVAWGWVEEIFGWKIELAWGFDWNEA